MTQSGDVHSTTTRFWLMLDTASAVQLLYTFLCGDLGAENVQLNQAQTAIRVRKAAGQKTVTGTFYFAASDTHAASGHTLVTMRREKVSLGILKVKAKLTPPGIYPPLALVLVGDGLPQVSRTVYPQGRRIAVGYSLVVSITYVHSSHLDKDNQRPNTGSKEYYKGD
jgi:hypothetical protein